MCTVTWLRSPGGYELFFNRDERRSRLEALGPRILEGPASGGERVRFIMPVDADFGGTWIAANAHGLAVGLLNGYRQGDEAARDPRSRGLLVRDLASARSVGEVLDRVAVCDPPRYRSFRLLALDPERSVVAEWDGRSLVRGDAEARVPLISSGFDETEVGHRRRAAFDAEVGDHRTPARLAAYQRSHAHGPSGYSVCMHRPEARTRSLTRIAVEPASVELVYHPGPPCETAEETTVRLARTA